MIYGQPLIICLSYMHRMANSECKSTLTLWSAVKLTTMAVDLGRPDPDPERAPSVDPGDPIVHGQYGLNLNLPDY